MIEDDHLKRFYISLKNGLIREKKFKNNSVLMSFLETRSASRFKILNESTISSNEIPRNILESLLERNYIQSFSNIENYVITAKGVWHYETRLKLLDEEKLLSYINKKFFADSKAYKQEISNLDDKEKVILFTMIAARTFSDKSSVNLRPNKKLQDKWLELLEASYNFLKDLKKINKITKEELFNKSGNEHIASSIFRHNNRMVQKTNSIYTYTGGQEYFLNLYDLETLKFSTEKLSYLFWKIFKGELSGEMVDKIIDYCNNVSKVKSIYLFDLKEHIFSLPYYDEKIRDSLLDSIESRFKWQKVG